MGELSRLPNIGKEVERQLNEAGILSAEDLKKSGSGKSVAEDPKAGSIRLHSPALGLGGRFAGR